MDIKDLTQEYIKLQRAEAMRVMQAKHGNVPVTMRDIKPTDLKDFTAGTGGTSKTMGENDVTVATGTTENTLSNTVPSVEVWLIEGIYLPPVTGVTTTYIAMDIGDAKMRWVDASRIGAETNTTFYFDTPLLCKPGDTVKVKFLTSVASATHPIGVLGKVFKAQG